VLPYSGFARLFSGSNDAVGPDARRDATLELNARSSRRQSLRSLETGTLKMVHPHRRRVRSWNPSGRSSLCRWLSISGGGGSECSVDRCSFSSWRACAFAGSTHQIRSRCFRSASSGSCSRLPSSFRSAISGFERSWADLASDYDIVHGGMLAFGMLVLVVSPVVEARLRRRCNDLEAAQRSGRNWDDSSRVQSIGQGGHESRCAEFPNGIYEDRRQEWFLDKLETGIRLDVP